MRRHKVETTKPCNPSRAQFCKANAKQETPNPPDNTSSCSRVQLQIQTTRRTWHTSRLPLGKAICADAGGSVTSQKRAQHQLPARRSA